MNQLQSIQINGQAVHAIGNTDLLKRPKTGLLCSRKCPADKILEAYDQFKAWAADPESVIISSFHSPVERECLRLLLKGKAGIILCPAREIETMRLPRDCHSLRSLPRKNGASLTSFGWKPALDEGRMLILSPFTEKRPSAQAIDRRNQFVAALADNLYIPYATPGGNLVNLKDLS